MPLAERDVNSQHQRPLARGKRLPAAGFVTGENAIPSPSTARAKETHSRPQRFLTPTKASAAKNTPPSVTDPAQTQAQSSRAAPRSRTQGSKLPRPNAASTPSKSAYSPPMSKWNPSVAINGSSEKTAIALQTSLPSHKAVGFASDQSLIAHEAVPSFTHQASAEKPLPSRPIASLAYAPSPSRDSRSLIDASERPLRISVAGTERDWPALTPNFPSTSALASTPLHTAMTGSTEASSKISASATSLVLTTPEPTAPHEPLVSDGAIQNAEVDGPGLRHSYIKSYFSTPEVSFASEYQLSASEDTQQHTLDVDAVENSTVVHPPRKDSLTTSHINNTPIERSRSTGSNISGPLEFARDIFETSRPHSPSPASFSRPRPTSFSQITSMITMSKAATDRNPVKSQKTASRIPLPDQTKATLVDIRGRRTSGIPVPKFEKGLSFGGRRIDSPDPLKVLDHGIKRRQLRRTNTGGSSSTVSTVPTRFLSNSTPTIDRSKANTPDSTMGSSSSEEEVTAPSDKPMHFVKHGYKPKHVNRVSGSNCAGATLKVYDEAEVVLVRPPPSNSPFTGPLPTIPSQSALPLLAASGHNSLRRDTRNKVVIKPTEFSAFAQRISVLEDSRDLFNGDRNGRQSLIGSDTKSELVGLLREAEHEDAMITQCGAEGLDAETKEEITSTLGMLEGRCGPKNTTADLEHLSRMFGRLKSGFEKAPKSAAFVEDATVAEQFLARRESIASNASDTSIRLGTGKAGGASPMPCKEDDATSQISRSKTVASKWSTSTPSAKEQSLPSAEAEPRRDTFGIEFAEIPPTLPPKHLTGGNPMSIGFPSRESGKAHRLLGTNQRAAGARKTTTRRESSPTLGIRIPGSVRTAREKARDATGSRENQSTTTNFEKLPTPNTNVFRVSQEPPRGRLPPGEKSSHRDSTKVPRSRSKSRFMLDKLNGLFSGRRDKRNSQFPPLPPAKDNSENQTSFRSPKEMQLDSPIGPNPKDTPVRSLTKMPTMTPPVDAVHPALRSAPSSSSLALSNTIGLSDADLEGRQSLQALSEKLLGRALKESDPGKKERLLSFAKVLTDSLISAREAQISAETAQSAARSAQLSYEMTMKSVAMLHRLASSMNRR